MGYISRHLPNFIITFAGLFLLFGMAAVSARKAWFSTTPRRLLLAAGVLVGFVVLVGQFVLQSARAKILVGPFLEQWCTPAAFVLLLGLAAFHANDLIVPRLFRSHVSPGRRQFLRIARGTLLAAPAAVTGYGFFIQRTDLRMREVSLPIKGLAKELDGFRMVQLSDIHLSPFLSESELARAVAMANEFSPHLALVTGDLITTNGDPLDAALRNVAALRSELGSLGCHGNHEVYAGVEDYVTEQGRRMGIRFLRSESQQVMYAGKPLNFVGVDYQRMREPYLEDVGQLIRPGMPNILLSHNPDVFPVAADLGFDATLAGHTHGGQITMEILNQNMSVARFYTPYVYGLYQRGNSSIYVTRGIGTVGLPVRLGAPPEIACIRLCAI